MDEERWLSGEEHRLFFRGPEASGALSGLYGYQVCVHIVHRQHKIVKEYTETSNGCLNIIHTGQIVHICNFRDLRLRQESLELEA